MLKTAETPRARSLFEMAAANTGRKPPKPAAILPGELTIEEHYEPPRWSSCSGTHERYSYRVKYRGRILIDWFEFEDEAHARETATHLLKELTPAELAETRGN